ncbi:hypothetical protein AMJ49_05035 [Parcubacteria bacterium DG_74_2]|nr:MAG: hypothetical protein AMJ49_05035 [Parcubacteria bacterium DG_74_2]
MELKTIYETDKAKKIGFKWPDDRKKILCGDLEEMIREWRAYIRNEHQEAKKKAIKDLERKPLIDLIVKLKELKSKIVAKTIFKEGSSDLISELQYVFIQEMISEVSKDIMAISRINPIPE